MRRALGKGLSQLIAEQFDSAPTEVPVEAIVPNARQPRTHFNEDSLQELASSIREFGILQPLVVRPVGEGRYELIAGERRLRAARLAGLESVPILLRSAGSQDSLELALIENIQREDINSLECARAYKRLTEEFGLTQEQIADKVGKSRTGVANTIRLLRLPAPIQQGLELGRISEGHARALLAFPSEAQQLAIYDQILEKGLNVREVEKAAKPREPKPEAVPPAPRPRPVPESSTPSDVMLQGSLSEFLGAPVKIVRNSSGGKLTIDFYSDDDLQRVLDIVGFSL